MSNAEMSALSLIRSMTPFCCADAYWKLSVSPAPAAGVLAAAIASEARPGCFVAELSTMPQTQARRPCVGCMYLMLRSFIFGWFLIFQYPSGHV